MPYIGKEPADIIATAVDTTTGDFSGNVTAGGTLGVTGVVTANAGIKVDNITIDGTEIDLSSGSFTIDSAANITLDCGTGEFLFNNGGNGNLLKIQADSSNVNFIAMVQDKDLVFKGNDGSSTITALTLDMSEGGNATFNGSVTAASLVADNLTLNSSTLTATGSFTIDSGGDINLDAAGNDIKLKVDGTQFGTFTKSSDDLHIISAIQDGDILLKGDDAGSGVTGLKLDFSEGGDATFNSNVRTSFLVQSGIGASGVARQTTASGSHVYTADQFRNSSGSQVGSIAVGTSSTTYNTSSDYRLKENVSYDFDATTRLKQLKPARFNFIADADTTVDGFLAHEVSSIVPEAITGAKDATQKIQNVVLNADGSFLADNISEKNWKKGKLTTDEDGNKIDPIYAEDTTWVASKTVPDYQSIDQSKLVPLLTKALQEQQATIEALTARITALESA